MMNHKQLKVFSGGLVAVVIVAEGIAASGAEVLTQSPSNFNGAASSVKLAPVSSNKTPVAYKQIAGSLMVAEARFHAGKLSLFDDFNPYSTKTNVNPPSLGSLGSIESLMYLYSFAGSDSKPITNSLGVEIFLEPGKLAYILQKDPFILLKYREGNDTTSTLNERLARLRDQLTTNSAYQLATQWLTSVEVDVDALEKKYQPQVTQQFYYDAPVTWNLGEPPPPGTPTKLLPIYDVCWGGPPDSSPPVWVEVYGPVKALIHLRMEDTRFSRRNPIVITNLAELLRQPDPPTKQLQLLNNRSNGPGSSKSKKTAREWAGTSAMLREANSLVNQLGLKETKPLLAGHVEATVFPTNDIAIGYLKSEKYEYHFDGGDQKPRKSLSGQVFIEPGKFIGLLKQSPFREYQNEQGRFADRYFDFPSMVGTNGAYQLATQWLANIKVDVAALEKKHKPMCVQEDYDMGKGVMRKGPVFRIAWGVPGDPDPPMRMVIFGPTRELIYLSILDTRFLKREAIRIP